MTSHDDQHFFDATRDWLATGRYFEIFGRQVFVFERGVNERQAGTECLLLLHGYPTSSHDWRGVVEHLPQQIHAIAPDFLGFGLSDKPEAFGYSLFGQADLVEELLKQCGVATAHVVSHDMGTSVHCELLARQAEGRLGFRLQTSTLLNGSMLQWLAHITPFQQLLAANVTLPQAIDFCRTVMAGIYVDALRGLMQKPEMITAVDARRDARVVALPGRASAPAGIGRIYARAPTCTRIVGSALWSLRTLRCNSCGPTATRLRTSNWDASSRRRVPHKLSRAGRARPFLIDRGSGCGGRKDHDFCQCMTRGSVVPIPYVYGHACSGTPRSFRILASAPCGSRLARSRSAASRTGIAPLIVLIRCSLIDLANELRVRGHRHRHHGFTPQSAAFNVLRLRDSANAA